MPKLRIAALVSLAAGIVLVLVAGARGFQRESRRPLRPLPPDPALVPIELLEALPFQLDEPFVHEWRAEKPLVSSGVVLVLRTAPELARARQTLEPVLYVGDQTAERVNAPESSDILIALVPAPIDADGALALDLTRTPIWFGTPALPERVDAATIAHERELARTSGVGPPALGERLIAQPSPALVFVRSRDELDPYLADLVELYSPEEADLVRGLRVPLTR